MGLWDNIRNTFQRIFQPAKYKEKQAAATTSKEKIPAPKQARDITPSEDIKITRESEEKPEEPKEEQKEEPTLEDLERIPEEGRTQEAKDKIAQYRQEAEETIKETQEILDGKEVEIPHTWGNKQQSVDMLNQTINENMDSEWSAATERLGIDIHGHEYAQHIKNAILNSNGRIDESIAELIAINAEKFKPRFSTYLDIYIENQEEPIIMTLYGTLPKEVMEQIDQEEINGMQVDSLKTYVHELRERLAKNTGALGSNVSDIQVKSGKITNYEIRVGFR